MTIAADFSFIDLLRRRGIAPEQVVVMRHRPAERLLAQQFTWIAEHREDVFIAYQSTQNIREENQLRSHAYLAGFLATAVGEATFVGLYQIGEPRRRSRESLMTDVAFNDLAKKFNGYQVTPKAWIFPLTTERSMTDLKGRLVVGWSGGVSGSRSWSRLALSKVSLGFPIIAIHPKSVFAQPKATPDWRQLVLSIEELKNVPEQWRRDLSQWRGIYYIVDLFDGKGYVGSASGLENLWGRWLVYAKNGHGGNKLLKGRDPSRFRFSILERIGPDLSKEEVVHMENKWKLRLHTRVIGLNDN
jgi:hypothetical protein